MPCSTFGHTTTDGNFFEYLTVTQNVKKKKEKCTQILLFDLTRGRL